MWILFWIIVGNEAPATGSQEFSTYKGCEEALLIMKSTSAYNYHHYSKAWCSKK